jgi:hypothetical protein
VVIMVPKPLLMFMVLCLPDLIDNCWDSFDPVHRVEAHINSVRRRAAVGTEATVQLGGIVLGEDWTPGPTKTVWCRRRGWLTPLVQPSGPRRVGEFDRGRSFIQS